MAKARGFTLYLVKEMGISEMVEFLNQFRLVIVGGFDGKERELERMGIDNFVRANWNWDSKGTPPQADMAVLCMRFMSHKLQEQVRSAYRDPDKILMYNGVNTKKLIAVCYDRLVQRMGGYDSIQG